MNIALWIVQILLALFFLMVGGNKLITPIADLAQQVGPWVSDVPAWLVRFIGLAQVAGALGLILPAVTRIQPRLTVFAADGLAIIMVLAALFHLSRGEYGPIAINVVLFLLATFVFYGRWKLVPIEPK